MPTRVRIQKKVGVNDDPKKHPSGNKHFEIERPLSQPSKPKTKKTLHLLHKRFASEMQTRVRIQKKWASKKSASTTIQRNAPQLATSTLN
jgi:hypothetical protein